MDMSQLLQLGAQTFINSKGSGSAGSQLDMGTLTNALSGLTGGSGGLDITSLVSGMQGNNMGDMLQSWLGDGENQQISGDQVSNLLGSDKISAFASQLGLTEQEAIGGLQDVMPNLVDKASSGGSLLDSIGGVSGALGMVNKLFN